MSCLQWKAEGSLTNEEIISKLGARGVRITNKNFRWIISNPFFAGYVSGKLLKNQLVKGKHPALIDIKPFLKANKALDNAPTVGIPKKSRHDELPLKIFGIIRLAAKVFVLM